MPFASTTSLISNNTVFSTVPLVPKKDYPAAFASLQSTYGTSGHVPTPTPPKKAKTQKHGTSTATSTPSKPGLKPRKPSGFLLPRSFSWK